MATAEGSNEEFASHLSFVCPFGHFLDRRPAMTEQGSPRMGVKRQAKTAQIARRSVATAKSEGGSAPGLPGALLRGARRATTKGGTSRVLHRIRTESATMSFQKNERDEEE